MTARGRWPQGGSAGVGLAGRRLTIFRHAETPDESVYIQPDVGKQAEVVARLPDLFPDDGHGKTAQGPCTPEPMGYAGTAKSERTVIASPPTTEVDSMGGAASVPDLAVKSDHEAPSFDATSARGSFPIRPNPLEIGKSGRADLSALTEAHLLLVRLAAREAGL